MSKKVEKLNEVNRGLREQIEQLDILIEEILALNSTIKLNVILNKVMSSATKLMKAQASSLMLLDKETEELYFAVVLGEKKSLLSNVRIKSGEGIAGWVLREGTPLLVEDVSKDCRFSYKIDDITGFNTRSIICVPLKVENDIIGVVEVLNPVNGGNFTEEDMELFNTFANLAAVSIQNSKMYNNLQELFLKEAQNQLNRLEVMSQISGVTLSSMDFSNLFKAMLEIVTQSLNSENGVIFLVNHSNSEVFPVVFRGFSEGTLLEKNKLNISKRVVEEVVHTRKPLKVEDFLDRAILPGEKVSSGETQAVIGIPVKSNQLIYGVIVIFSRKGGDISHQDIDFLKAFAARMAHSLEKIDISLFFGKNKIRTQKVDFWAPKADEYRLALESIGNIMEKGLVFTDKDFNIKYINKKAELTFGIANQDLAGQNCINCHSPAIHNAVYDAKKRIMENRDLEKVDFFKNMRSENKKVNACLIPIKDPFLNICGYFMLMEDILPEKKIAQRKDKSERKPGRKTKNKSKKQ